MTEDIVPIHKVKVSSRCRKCGSNQIIHSAEQDETSLWTLTEGCTMCLWTVKVSNVKLGV